MIFITQGRYTNEGLKGLVDKPEDRMAEVKGLIERAGGKLIDYYITFGEYDWIVISEGPDALGYFSRLVTAGAGGSVTNLNTTIGFTTAEAMKGYEMAQKDAGRFRSAGT